MSIARKASTTLSNFKTSLFDDTEKAQAAYEATLKRGYAPEDIHIIMSDETKEKFAASSSPVVEIDSGRKTAEGVAIGSSVGGAALGVIGAVVALSTTIVVPGLGLVVAGPLAAGLVGLGAGSVTGGIIGALIGAGIPEERAKIYETGIKNGGIVLGVDAQEDDDAGLLNEWKRHQGTEAY